MISGTISKDINTGKESTLDIDKTNALKFKFDNGLWYALRPSGTEPKIKLYLYSRGSSDKTALDNLNKMKETVLKKLDAIEPPPASPGSGTAPTDLPPYIGEE